MLKPAQIWDILVEKLPPGEWMTTSQIYSLVEETASLDSGDREPVGAKSTSPRWKRNVRNVLQRRKVVGDLDWNGKAGFRRPSA